MKTMTESERLAWAIEQWRWVLFGGLYQSGRMMQEIHHAATFYERDVATACIWPFVRTLDPGCRP